MTALICPISMEEIKNEYRLSCGHIFEYENISAWYKNNDSCPLCRSKKEGLIHLFIELFNSEQIERIKFETEQKNDSKILRKLKKFKRPKIKKIITDITKLSIFRNSNLFIDLVNKIGFKDAQNHCFNILFNECDVTHKQFNYFIKYNTTTNNVISEKKIIDCIFKLDMINKEEIITQLINKLIKHSMVRYNIINCCADYKNDDTLKKILSKLYISIPSFYHLIIDSILGNTIFIWKCNDTQKNNLIKLEQTNWIYNEFRSTIPINEATLLRIIENKNIIKINVCNKIYDLSSEDLRQKVNYQLKYKILDQQYNIDTINIFIKKYGIDSAYNLYYELMSIDMDSQYYFGSDLRFYDAICKINEMDNSNFFTDFFINEIDLARTDNRMHTIKIKKYILKISMSPKNSIKFKIFIYQI